MIKVCIHCAKLVEVTGYKCPDCGERLHTLETVCDLAWAHQRDLDDRYETTYLYGVEDESV